MAYDYSGEEQTTFAELLCHSTDLARGLASLVLGRGDFCAIITSMNLNQVRLVCAFQLTGAVPVLFDPAAPPKLLRRRLAQCRAKRAIVDPELIEPLKAELENNDESVACLTPADIERRSETRGPELPEVKPEGLDLSSLRMTDSGGEMSASIPSGDSKSDLGLSIPASEIRPGGVRHVNFDGTGG